VKVCYTRATSPMAHGMRTSFPASFRCWWPARTRGGTRSRAWPRGRNSGWRVWKGMQCMFTS